MRLHRSVTPRMFLVVMCVILLGSGGCTSNHSDMDWRAYMEGMDADDDVTTEVADSGDPDAPIAPLPPAPEPDAAGQSRAGEVTIQPESVIQVSLREDPGLDGSYRVNEIYAVELGYVGPVFLRNMTEEEAEAKIKQVLEKRYFNQATVNVRILRVSYDKVAVHGAVELPGVIKIGGGDRISLNDTLLRAGRITTGIKGAQVRIIRGGMQSAVAPALDGEVYALTNDEGEPYVPDVDLWNNDIAYVFSRVAQGESGTVSEGPKEILVLGEVKRRGIYRFDSASPCTLMHLIFEMEGFPDFADTKSIKIIRRNDEGEEETLVVDASDILDDGDPADDVPLENGDRVIVPARRFGLFN